MAKCDLQIVFDRDDRTYLIGQKIAGSVRVTAKEDCVCRKLTIASHWCASGHGTTDQGQPEEEQTLFSGAWRAGETAAHPFEISAPPGPVTYRGALFNVGWQIRALADVAGIEATASEDFVLLPGQRSENLPPGTLDELPPQVTELIDKPAGSYAGGCSQVFAILFGVVALFVGLPCLAIGVLNLITFYIQVSLPISIPTGLVQSIFLIAVGGLFTSLGTRAFITLLHAAVARSRLGAIDVEVSPTPLRPGESVTCAVRLQPRGSIKLTEATAKITATEYAIGRTGNADGAITQTLKQVVHQSSATMVTERTIRGGESAVLTAVLNIPPDAPCTFWGGNNKLIWTLVVEIKMKRWPDWSQSIPLTVRP